MFKILNVYKIALLYAVDEDDPHLLNLPQMSELIFLLSMKTTTTSLERAAKKYVKSCAGQVC